MPILYGQLTGETIESVDYKPDVHILDDDVEKFKIRNRKKYIEHGRLCFKCKKIELFELNYSDVSLTIYGNHKYCQNCLTEAYIENNPDPSDSTNKYFFNSYKLNWELRKVMVPCIKCERKRWLNIENQWKKICLKCFRSNNSA